MRSIFKFSLFLLFVTGFFTCLLCGLGVIQRGILGQENSLFPEWLHLTFHLDSLVRGAYWGLAVVSFSAITWAAFDRWTNLSLAPLVDESDVLVATPIRDRLPGTEDRSWR